MELGLPPRTADELRDEYAPILDAHRAWLDHFEPWRLRKWEAQLATETEAAIFESVVRRLLCTATHGVAPAEDRKRGGPDFSCAGGAFRVEATCISIEVATKATRLEDRSFRGGSVGVLTGRIATEVGEKAVQLARASAGPVLVAVGTLHVTANWICLTADRVEHALRGDELITIPISMKTGAACGPMQVQGDAGTTPFMLVGEDAAAPISTWRRSVAGVLVLGLDAIRPDTTDDRVARGVTGLLHPDAASPFDRSLLPTIRFLRLADGWRQGLATCEEA